MSALSPTSKVILRHKDALSDKQIVIAGDTHCLLPLYLEIQNIKIHTAWYHHRQMLARVLGEESVKFGLIVDNKMVYGCNTLIYCWPKSKSEALFQLTNLLSLLPLGCDVFVVGENRSGVRSVESMLATWCPLAKIDRVRHCSLYKGKLIQQPKFNAEAFWQFYKIEDVVIKTLPGIFSHDKLDSGSQLLLSTFDRPLQGHIADIGCGAGVLSAVLAKEAEGVQLTLIDSHASALEASCATLAANRLQGKVLASDVYSAINGRFDMIISNPPFHDSTQTNLKTAEVLIRGALNHLRIGGKLRIVANSFLPYSDLFDAVFGNHQVLVQNSRFKVYQAIHLKKFSYNKDANIIR